MVRLKYTDIIREDDRYYYAIIGGQEFQLCKKRYYVGV